MGILSVSRRRGGPPQGAAPLLQSFDLEGVAEYIKGGKAKKIIIMVCWVTASTRCIRLGWAGCSGCTRSPASWACLYVGCCTTFTAAFVLFLPIAPKSW